MRLPLSLLIFGASSVTAFSTLTVYAAVSGKKLAAYCYAAAAIIGLACAVCQLRIAVIYDRNGFVKRGIFFTSRYTYNEIVAFSADPQSEDSARKCTAPESSDTQSETKTTNTAPPAPKAAKYLKLPRAKIIFPASSNGWDVFYGYAAEKYRESHGGTLTLIPKRNYHLFRGNVKHPVSCVLAFLILLAFFCLVPVIIFREGMAPHKENDLRHKDFYIDTYEYFGDDLLISQSKVKGNSFWIKDYSRLVSDEELLISCLDGKTKLNMRYTYTKLNVTHRFEVYELTAPDGTVLVSAEDTEEWRRDNAAPIFRASLALPAIWAFFGIIFTVFAFLADKAPRLSFILTLGQAYPPEASDITLAKSVSERAARLRRQRRQRPSKQGGIHPRRKKPQLKCGKSRENRRR